jgi:hypothetical protein
MSDERAYEALNDIPPGTPVKLEIPEDAAEELRQVGMDRNLREDEYEHGKFCDAVDTVLEEFGEMLKEKNKKYGNSALHPVRVFSKADAKEQIKVRLDDKISRLVRGTGEETEDVYKDLTGYLFLFMILDRGLI